MQCARNVRSVAHFDPLLTQQVVCDYLVSCNTPGVRLPELLVGRKLNDGVVGVLGVISALVVLYNQWPEQSRSV